MTISTTKKLAGITAAAGLIIALAGCGSAPAATPTGSGNAGGAVDGFNFGSFVIAVLGAIVLLMLYRVVIGRRTSA